MAAAVVACGDPEPVEPDAAPPMVCGAELRGARHARPTQCGRTLDFTPINRYAGGFAPAQLREDAVALVAGACTGTWIAAAAGPVVITAGHCAALGARLVVAFNVEAEPDGDALVTEGLVIERSDEPDYALLRLDRAPAGIAPTPLATAPGSALAIIQHPRGAPKVIAEGPFLAACDRQIYYVDLDTLVGSSGAGILNEQGGLVGVHTDGDCTTGGGGANRGWTAAAIEAASAHLAPADLDPR
jgi:hypothetical protein